MRIRALLLAAMIIPAAVHANKNPATPTTHPNIPLGPVAAQPKYGLCGVPQNAADFPTKPVLVEKSPCEISQTFQSTSPSASYGGKSCGGYTIAFGPLGSLDPTLSEVITLTADWGDAPLTATTCPTAQVSAVAWGERCLGTNCAPGGGFELIGGGPTASKGTWNKISNVCYISVQFNAQKTSYRTLNIDAIATQTQGGSTVRKRVSSNIYVSRLGEGCIKGLSKKK